MGVHIAVLIEKDMHPIKLTRGKAKVLLHFMDSHCQAIVQTSNGDGLGALDGEGRHTAKDHPELEGAALNLRQPAEAQATPQAARLTTRHESAAAAAEMRPTAWFSPLVLTVHTKDHKQRRQQQHGTSKYAQASATKKQQWFASHRPTSSRKAAKHRPQHKQQGQPRAQASH